MKKFKGKIKGIFSRIKRISGYVFKPCLQWVKDGNFRARVRYARYYKKLKVCPKTVLFESFYGRGTACNPYAIFREMLQNEQYKDYKLIWVVDNLADKKLTIDEYQPYKNVEFVQYASREYLKALATCQYLFNNSTFLPYFVKKENQIYVNTWHGIPLKHMGRDLPDGAVVSNNVKRTLLQTDYLLSANPMMTKMYTECYHIKEIYNGEIIEEGYPRNDTLHSDREYVLQKLAKNGVKIDPNKKIILYAPTWRGTDFGNPQDDANALVLFRETILQNIDATEYQFLIKPHNALHKIMAQMENCDYIIPTSFDANEALAVTDILISDYSSIFFDFLGTQRPILFYITDEEEYREQRGTYFSLDELPAPYTANPLELAGWINHVDDFSKTYQNQYQAMCNRCENAEITNISARILDIVLQGEKDYKKGTIRTGKKKILMLKGAPLLNGIGSSCYNLLNSIDYAKYDVTLYMYNPKNKEQRNNIDKAHSKCRVLIRKGTFTASLWENILISLANEYTYTFKWLNKIFPHDAYQREVLRSFGNSTFDYIIDFDGYSRLLDLIALHTPVKKRYIWQHNDMHNEFSMRFHWLRHIFSLYPHFDGIVGCAEAAMEVNREKLGTPETYKKFTYATNLFDGERVNRWIESAVYAENNSLPYFCGESTSNQPRYIPLGLVGVDAQEISGEKMLLGPRAWVNGIVEAQPMKPEKLVKFISVGRCSPEKNHRALIDGFAKLLQEYPNCMLFIVGHGPQFKTEYNYVMKKKLQKNIIMTGNISNPYGLLQKCDCFILPSKHEGQPIVLLEARMLGMPIIMSNFSSAKSSLMDEGQLLIETAVDDICQGMKDYIEGNVPCDYHFDVAAYNQKCYAEFEQLFAE